MIANKSTVNAGQAKAKPTAKKAKIKGLQWVSLGLFSITCIIIIAFLFDSFMRNFS